MDLLESLETGFQDLLGCIQNSLYLKVSWALLLRCDPSEPYAECLECSMRYLHHGSWGLQHALPFCWAPGISASTDRPLLLFCLSAMPDSLRPHGLQHIRLPCPSLSLGVCSNSCPLSWWCHPTTYKCIFKLLTQVHKFNAKYKLYANISNQALRILLVLSVPIVIFLLF